MSLWSTPRVLVVSTALVVAISIQLCGGAPQFTKDVSTAPDEKDYRFTSGHSALRIPLEEDDGHIFLQIRINDSKPLWFGVDTGATHSLIDKRWAESLGLKSESNRSIGGAGGYEEAAIFKDVSIKLPGAELYHQTLWGLPLDAVASAKGREIAGIIGYELFKYFVVDVDYAAKLMNLYEPGTYEYRGTGQSVPLKVQHDGAIYVQATLKAPRGNPIEGEFVIDTGGNKTLLLARPFVEQHRLLALVGKTLTVQGGGVGGGIELAMGRLESLRVGPFVISNPIAGLTKTGEIADPGKAGNIGGKFLQRFRVIFDYSRQRMILEPNARLTEAEEWDMSGVALTSEGPTFNVMKVVRVRENSPGADSGLRPQDVIVAIDGQPATTLTLSKLRIMFTNEGREYLISVKRGALVVPIKIKLRRLI